MPAEKGTSTRRVEMYRFADDVKSPVYAFEISTKPFYTGQIGGLQAHSRGKDKTMSDEIETEEAQEVGHEESRVPTTGRTLVIVMSQIVVIVALVVLWSVLRGRRSSD